MKNTLESKLSHSRAAYIFAIESLPTSEQKFPLTLRGFTFSDKSQIDSMLIELGWSFFCRYEACLEAHTKELGIRLEKGYTMKDWLEEQKVDIPRKLTGGLDIYRTIRNKLHHEDGAALCDNEDEEIHILPKHMENFYELFVWCGLQMERYRKNNTVASGY